MEPAEWLAIAIAFGVAVWAIRDALKPLHKSSEKKPPEKKPRT